MFSLFKPPGQSTSKPKLPPLPRIFCVKCFEDGKTPVFYSVCRDNESSKQRHINGQHGENKELGLKLKWWNPKEFAAKAALEKWMAFYDKSTSVSEVSHRYLVGTYIIWME